MNCRLRVAWQLGGKTVAKFCRKKEKGRGEVWVNKADIRRGLSQKEE